MPGRKRRRSGWGRFWRGFLIAVFLLALFSVGAIAGIVTSYGRNLPDISRMADYQPASTTRIFARDGTQLASVYRENRVCVPIGRIPPVVRNAFVANEDHNFYRHHGIDFVSIVRAAFADVTHQQFQGASTITQQLARRLFLNDQVSLSRKVQEALLAMEIERYYTKDEILERYLNIIYLGAGAYGVDAAAHTYFGRGVDKLTVAQAAMLAGVVAAPSDYSPFANLPLARDRERHVLDRMVESGYITSAPSRCGLRGSARFDRAAPDRAAGLSLSVLHDLRDRAPRADFRSQRRRGRRPAGLHVAGPADAERSARGGDLGRQPGRRRGNRRAPGGPGCAASVDRRDSGDGRRNWIYAAQSVQSGVASAPAARLVVQNLRLHRRHRYRNDRLDDHRRLSGQLSDGRWDALVARWTTTTATWGRSLCAKR